MSLSFPAFYIRCFSDLNSSYQLIQFSIAQRLIEFRRGRISISHSKNLVSSDYEFANKLSCSGSADKLNCSGFADKLSCSYCPPYTYNIISLYTKNLISSPYLNCNLMI